MLKATQKTIHRKIASFSEDLDIEAFRRVLEISTVPLPVQETLPRLDECDRRKQTSYESFSIRRGNLPDPSKDKSTWTRIEHVREFVSQEETAKHIERLNVEGLGVKEQERVVRAAKQLPPEIDVDVETESGNNNIKQANTRAWWEFHNNINLAGTRTWWGSHKNINRAGTSMRLLSGEMPLRPSVLETSTSGLGCPDPIPYGSNPSPVPNKPSPRNLKRENLVFALYNIQDHQSIVLS